MNELKCPFCQQELKEIELGECWFLDCPKCHWTGEEQLWQALIDTKKKLDIAVEALKEYANSEHWDFEHFYNINTYDIAQEALEQIESIKKE